MLSLVDEDVVTHDCQGITLRLGTGTTACTGSRNAMAATTYWLGRPVDAASSFDGPHVHETRELLLQREHRVKLAHDIFWYVEAWELNLHFYPSTTRYKTQKHAIVSYENASKCLEEGGRKKYKKRRGRSRVLVLCLPARTYYPIPQGRDRRRNVKYIRVSHDA